jgi:hypothetical protein
MSLSGGAHDVVGRTSLMVGKKRLTLSCDRDVEATIGDVVRRRLKTVAAHTRLESRLVLRRRILASWRSRDEIFNGPYFQGLSIIGTVNAASGRSLSWKLSDRGVFLFGA